MAGQGKQGTRKGVESRIVSSADGGVDKQHSRANAAAESLDLQSRTGRIGSELAFETHGLRIGVSLDDAAWQDALRQRLPPGWRPAPVRNLDRYYRVEQHLPDDSAAGGVEVHLTADGVYRLKRDTYDDTLIALESQIQYFVSEFAFPCLFVHAGVVGWRGRAFMLPGASRAGKSTLVAALVAAGATYYSDEYAVIDLVGRVHPYARPLALREGPLGPAGRIDLTHRAPKIDMDDVSLPVGLVALLQYEADERWHVERLTPPQAVMAMCEHTVAIQRRPKDALDALGRVADTAAAFRGTRGDVHDAVERLLEGDWW